MMARLDGEDEEDGSKKLQQIICCQTNLCRFYQSTPASYDEERRDLFIYVNQ